MAAGTCRLGRTVVPMKTEAIVMRGTGGPEVLEPATITLPWPGRDDEVLVRLRAASVNPADTFLRQLGPYVGDGQDCVLGHDGAGVVEATGPAVTGVKPGDAVCFCNGGIGATAGTYAHHAVVPEGLLVPIPENVDFIHAAALPLVFITLWEAFYERARVRPGEHVLVHGAAGGTGHIGVQVARLLGARVAATAGTSERARFAGDLGAECTIVHRDRDFVAVAREWTAGRGLDVALDNVGEQVMLGTLSAMATYGRVVTLMGTPGDTEALDAYNGNLDILNVMMLTPMWRGMEARQRAQAGMVALGMQWLNDGRLKIHVHDTWPLARVAAAHSALEAGGIRGKIVLKIGE